ncbi:MAG: hypothetical protein HY320_06905, partial [Armatimonadetes bacterium]|nr:hypothetical protein [Armatimonadota bacterium]
MPTFQYTIRDNAGQVRTGTAEADNQQVLSRRLQEQGFQIQAITRAKAVRRPGQGGITFGGVRLRDLSVACRQFSTM